MTDTKWTPGPWEAEPNASNASWRITGPTGEGVADTGIWSIEHREEMIANARLIAAAPDMYEALKNLVRYAEAARHTAGMGKTQAARLDAAKAALSKAKGRE